MHAYIKLFALLLRDNSNLITHYDRNNYLITINNQITDPTNLDADAIKILQSNGNKRGSN